VTWLWMGSLSCWVAFDCGSLVEFASFQHCHFVLFFIPTFC